jgi:predicted TIM-barrel fold metal-dependent hydrolase
MRKVLVVAVLVLLVGSRSAAQQQGPIIDMHMHARMGPALRDGKPVPRPCMPAPCNRQPAIAVERGDPLRLTLQAMDRHNIVLGFLSDPLENVFEWVNAAPNRFIPSPVVLDPKKVDIARLRREYENKRLQGMGELATQYEGVAPNDPSLEPFFALAEEFDVPLLIHVEGIAGGSQRFRIAQGHPQQLEDVLARHARLRLYIENAGFPFIDETIALMYRYPQVYVDVSTITWIIPRPMFYRALSTLVDAGLASRIMFGSDQMNWPETIDLAIEAIRTAPMLTAEQKRDIFYNNAARFLRLGKRP